MYSAFYALPKRDFVRNAGEEANRMMAEHPEHVCSQTIKAHTVNQTAQGKAEKDLLKSL